MLFHILHSQQSVAIPPKVIWTSLISSFWTGIDLYNLAHGLAVRPLPIKTAENTNNMKKIFMFAGSLEHKEMLICILNVYPPYMAINGYIKY